MKKANLQLLVNSEKNKTSTEGYYRGFKLLVKKVSSDGCECSAVRISDNYAAIEEYIPSNVRDSMLELKTLVDQFCEEPQTKNGEPINGPSLAVWSDPVAFMKVLEKLGTASILQYNSEIDIIPSVIQLSSLSDVEYIPNKNGLVWFLMTEGNSEAPTLKVSVKGKTLKTNGDEDSASRKYSSLADYMRSGRSLRDEESLSSAYMELASLNKLTVQELFYKYAGELEGDCCDQQD